MISFNLNPRNTSVILDIDVDTKGHNVRPKVIFRNNRY